MFLFLDELVPYAVDDSSGVGGNSSAFCGLMRESVSLQKVQERINARTMSPKIAMRDWRSGKRRNCTINVYETSMKWRGSKPLTEVCGSSIS